MVTRNSAISDKPRDTCCNMQWRGWPPKHALPVCVATPNLVVLGETVKAKIGESPKMGSSDTMPLGTGRGWPAANKLPRHVCYLVEFGRSAAKGKGINRGQPPKWG